MLKINVEKSELAVLKGISEEHWSIIKQIVLEVDVDDSIPAIVELLEKHRFEYVIVQDPFLHGTALRYVYALGPASGRHLMKEMHTANISLQPFPEQILTQEDLNRYLRERLPSYMLPSSYLIIESLPLTANGKVDNQALHKLAASHHGQATSTGAPPAKDLEDIIASCWRDVLKIDQVGRDANFFDLGGHSLLLIQVHEKLKQRLATDLSVVDLFPHPTIHSLAKHLSLTDATRHQVSKNNRFSQRAIAVRKQGEIRQARQRKAKLVIRNNKDEE